MTRGTRYFNSTSQETVLNRTGRAMGRALKVLGQNVTFPEVALAIIDDLDVNGDNDLNAELLLPITICSSGGLNGDDNSRLRHRRLIFQGGG